MKYAYGFLNEIWMQFRNVYLRKFGEVGSGCGRGKMKYGNARDIERMRD